MSDIDDFLAARGRLAGLLRALPPFEAPAQMEARFLAQLPPDRALPAADGVFEPPPTLAAAVLAEAGRLDAAQAPRRAGLLHELEQHGAQAALGGELSPAAADWLRAQTPPPSVRVPRRRAIWIAPLGGALAATLALGVALQVLREPAPEPHGVTIAAPAAAPPPAAEKSAPPATPATADEARVAPPAPAATLPRAPRALTPAAPAAAIEPTRNAKVSRAEPAAESLAAAPSRSAAPGPEAAPPGPALPQSMSALRAEARRDSAEAAGIAAPSAKQEAQEHPREPLQVGLDSEPRVLARAMLERNPQARRWRLTVAAADHVAATALQAELLAELAHLEPHIELELSIGEIARGRISIEALE